MPLPYDPRAQRKKYALLRFARAWNVKNPSHEIVEPPGFDPETDVIGTPAREFVRNMQRVMRLPITGNFDHLTLLKLFPPSIRGHVMARAHAEVGEHEWPPGSNRGEIVEYLKAVGLSGGYPWCAAFVTWVLKKEGFEHFPGNPAYVPSWGEWAKAKGLTKPHMKSQLGDLWCWNWNGGALDHIGFCDEGVKGSMAWFVDGNVGAYGGSVTDSARPESGIALVIDLVKLSRLK
jgi:hypothetical protein